DRREPVLARVESDDIFGVGADVLLLRALKEALDLFPYLEQVLRLLRRVELLLVLGVPRIGGELEQLRSASAAQKAVIIDLGAGNVVAIGRIQGHDLLLVIGVDLEPRPDYL